MTNGTSIKERYGTKDRSFEFVWCEEETLRSITSNAIRGRNKRPGLSQKHVGKSLSFAEMTRADRGLQLVCTNLCTNQRRSKLVSFVSQAYSEA